MERYFQKLVNNYFPCKCKIPITTTIPHKPPTKKDPEVTASPQIEAPIPDKPVLMMALLGVTDGAGAMSVGFGFTFGISFAKATNAGPKSVTPKMAKEVVKPIPNDFLFERGFSRASFNFS